MVRNEPHHADRWRIRIRALLGVALLPYVMGFECTAQMTLDGSLGPQQVLAGPNFTIDSAQGQIRGSNLFHSFGRFNVQTGQSATFTNSMPGPIANILSRVTGGERSFIDGTVRSSIAGANLYLFNPSGVVFGPNAALDVSGAFHVTTADYLRFSDGGAFNASLQNASVLTVAPPVAFGFLSQTPAAISFDRTVLSVPQGKTLSVIGGDVQMVGGVLRAQNGLIQMVSAASPGEAIPGVVNAIPDLQTGSFARLGQIQLSALANATTSSVAGAGTVLIRGGRLLLDNAFLSANTTGAGNGATLGIDVRITDDAVFTNGAQAIAATVGSGSGGNLDVTAGSVLIASGNATRNTGLIAGQLNATGTGNGGRLTVKAGSIQITGSNNPNLATGILGSTSGPGAGGPLQVISQDLTITNNAEISNSTFGPGPAGSATVNVDGAISITGSTNPDIFTGIFANTFGTGRGGTLVVDSGSMDLTQRASIQAGTFFFGDAGSATVRTGRLEISNGSGIFTSALFGAGNAGDLTVNANSLVIRGVRDSINPLTSATEFTGLSTSTGFFGKRGGNLYVSVADTLLVTDKGTIASVSTGAGNAGSIQVTAGSLAVTERAVIVANAFSSGRGGNIDIRANDVTVSGAGALLGPGDTAFSLIGSQAAGATGSAGDVTIAAGTLKVLDGGHVETTTFGAGKAGNINVQADVVLISGINAALEAFLRASPSGLTGAASSTIASGSAVALTGQTATGNGGAVRITGGDVLIDAGARLSTQTRTSGAGGSIEVTADRITLTGNSFVTADSLTARPAGKAGNISLNARDTVQVIGSKVATTADFAEGGNIAITGNRVQLIDGAAVTAQTLGPGNAGNITISTNDTLFSKNSVVTTESIQADGGNITLIAPTMVHLVDSKATTAVGTGQGKGGNIIIDPQFIIFNRSEIRADAFGGPGGNMTISADVFLTQDSLISASSALSTPGTIDIQARITDISGNVARLPEGAPPVAALLRAACAARLAGGSISTLVVAGREGLPPDPEGVLPSPLLSAESPTPAGERMPVVQRVDDWPRLTLAVSDQLCSSFRAR